MEELGYCCAAQFFHEVGVADVLVAAGGACEGVGITVRGSDLTPHA